MDRGKSPGGPRQEATIDGKSPGGPPGSDDRLGIDRGRPGTRRAAGNRRQRAPEGRWHFARRIPAPRKVRGVSPGTDFLLLTARGVSPDTVPALREVRGVSPKRGFRLLTVSGVSPKRWGHIRPPVQGQDCRDLVVLRLLGRRLDLGVELDLADDRSRAARRSACTWAWAAIRKSGIRCCRGPPSLRYRLKVWPASQAASPSMGSRLAPKSSSTFSNSVWLPKAGANSA